MRHVQLIAISGSIGAALFVSIGNPLVSAGPLGLLIGVSLWCTVIWAATNCLSEMTVLHPVDGGFINYAARYVDQSFGTALGWNVSDFPLLHRRDPWRRADYPSMSSRNGL